MATLMGQTSDTYEHETDACQTLLFQITTFHEPNESWIENHRVGSHSNRISLTPLSSRRLGILHLSGGGGGSCFGWCVLKR